MGNNNEISSRSNENPYLNEMVFSLYEKELWIIKAIEAMKNIDISNEKSDTSTKIAQLKYLYNMLKQTESEIIPALFPDLKPWSKKIPLTKKNIEILQPIIKKLWILLVYRYEKDQEYLSEIWPILMWEKDGSWYYLKIITDMWTSWLRIRSIVVSKDEIKQKNKDNESLEDDVLG